MSLSRLFKWFALLRFRKAKRMIYMYKENVPIRLKEARKRSGFTQVEVAKLTGINRSTLKNYELGDIFPSIEALARLAEFYGVSADWLLGLVQQNHGNINHKELKNRNDILDDLE